ncbi:MAG: hypothetical protein LUI05_04485 [Oscillospiraceae bacterium]|nr:hypothetical protein [Oscillospiraceae bacterium]
MKIRNLFLCVIMAAVFTLVGCSDTSAEDAALAQKLMGAWVPLVDENYTEDEDGNVLSFTVYEFTGYSTKVHIVNVGVVYSYPVNEYTITDGKFKVIVDGKAEYAKIDFSEEGNLLWYTDTETTEFRPLTDEEQSEFGIPIGQTLTFETEEGETGSQDAGEILESVHEEMDG